MTVNEASEHLYKWFYENDTFEITRDFKKIIAISEDEESDRAAILAGLERLYSLNLIKFSSIASGSGKNALDKKYWIVVSPFKNNSQSVQISFSTALMISQLINPIIKVSSSGRKECDPTNLVESDIQNLAVLFIAARDEVTYLQSLNESKKDK